MSIYEDGDDAVRVCNNNLAKSAKDRFVSQELNVQVAIAQSNLAIAAYLKVLCQLLEKK
jgi:hypothetical protein